METPRLETLVNELEKEVSPYKTAVLNEKKKQQIAPLFQTTAVTSSQSSRFAFLRQYKFYVAIPILVVVLLAAIRPKFVYDERYDAKGKAVLTFSFKRFVLFWIGLSFAFIFALFVYRYKYGTTLPSPSSPPVPEV
jgi:Sec-independent protein secretion pathway component TatC